VLERKARIQAAAAGEMTMAQLAEKWMTDHVRPKLKPRAHCQGRSDDAVTHRWEGGWLRPTGGAE
jgi:hypothetical protein